ncbi:uncharacterized protein [Lepisosteus oculatus]|uniref:uncharacterized protein isoform X1 n=1 Tax=Lepisosteus oculatus TaxID=7918 RepID=UPI0035F5176D
MILFAFFYILNAFEVRPGFADLSETPEVEVHLKHYYIGDDISIRCGAKRGIRCHFYMNRSEVPFRSVPYRQEYGQCHLSLSVEELVGDRDFGNSIEVSLSCAVELQMDGQLNISQHSKAEKVTVIDKLDKYGRPHIQVEHKVIKDERSVQVLCHSEAGIRCFFYSGHAKQPFSSISYSKELKACHLTVPQKTLLTRTEDRMSPEILLSCTVEVNLEGRAVTSRHSKSVKVNINRKSAGWNVTEVPLSENTIKMTSSFTPGSGYSSVKVMGSAVGGLTCFTITVVLAVIYLKCKRNKLKRERKQFHRSSICKGGPYLIQDSANRRTNVQSRIAYQNYENVQGTPSPQNCVQFTYANVNQDYQRHTKDQQNYKNVQATSSLKRPFHLAKDFSYTDVNVGQDCKRPEMDPHNYENEQAASSLKQPFQLAKDYVNVSQDCKRPEMDSSSDDDDYENVPESKKDYVNVLEE